MKPTACPRFGKGVKLRHDGNGSIMLLMELVDGTRPLAEIVGDVAARFDVSADRAGEDLFELFERLEQRGLVQ
jgi:hypothetical protein